MNKCKKELNILLDQCDELWKKSGGNIDNGLQAYICDSTWVHPCGKISNDIEVCSCDLCNALSEYINY